MIYLDNAATTRLSETAFEAMRPYMLDQFANPAGTYSFASGASNAVEEARKQLAGVIGAKAGEIFFTSGGTESDNWAIKGMLRHDDRRATITSQIEHHAILHACESIERLGYPIVYLPVDNEGIISPDMLSSFITDETTLVSVMLVNNEIGTI